MESAELVFTVDGSTATPADPISLADAGLRERQELQEWVIAHPEILGPGVMIVTFEFDRWWAAGGSRERDRLDVLGIDLDGRLVVAELKRDAAPDTVEMQAIKYAAMASRFTEDTLIEAFARFLAHGELPVEDAARAALVEKSIELDPDVLRRPRIVLVARSFPPVVTATAVWLNEMGLDLTLRQVQAYRVFDGKTVITVSQLYPVPDVEDFTVGPLRAEVRASEEGRRRRRESNAVTRLIRSGEVEDGTPVHFRTELLNDEEAGPVTTWLDEEPKRARAVWYNDLRHPLVWEEDGEGYKPTPLAQTIFANAGIPTKVLPGPKWWLLPDGRSLSEAAGYGAGFDWGELHRVLEDIPPGWWTTYGALASVVGTSAQYLGRHVATCPDCVNAWRVLGNDGRPRPNFNWTDPTDTRSQEEALTEEGLIFLDGTADWTRRMSSDDLAEVV